MIWPFLAIGQGCCSGGAPISANLGFSSVPKNTFQAALTFDINNLSKLKDNSQTLSGDERTRATYSLLLNLGYSFTSRFSVDLTIIPYVRQVRSVSIDGVPSEFTVVEGFGDMVVLPKLLISKVNNPNLQWQMAVGLKIPTGNASIKINGITGNPDIQPGSGAWDALFWSNFYYRLPFRKSMGLTSTVNFRLTGANDQYLESHIYEFGDDFHWLNTVADQFVLGSSILSPNLGLRYRYITGSAIDTNILDNTGGSWLTTVFGASWQLNKWPVINVLAELPIYSNVTGVQLSSSYRLSFGLQYQIGGKGVRSNLD